jgi:hypothetical protein
MLPTDFVGAELDDGCAAVQKEGLTSEPHCSWSRQPKFPTAPVITPADQPPAAVVKALQWMPRPSIRTALGLGVVAVATLAAVSRRVA